MEKFAYSKSIRVGYWGCNFDSLLELKFALSIKDEYDFIRSPVHIYYDPRTRTPTNISVIVYDGTLPIFSSGIKPRGKPSLLRSNQALSMTKSNCKSERRFPKIISAGKI